jgi:hypothetical protein
MGRIRRDGTTKVWHNPEISGRRGGHDGAPRVTPSPEDRRATSAHRAALEALFSPKKTEEDAGKVAKALEAATGKPGRIVLAPPPQADPRAQDRQKLLGKLLSAEGRPAITKAANEFFKNGFTLPQEQDVYLQLLEHTSEERVCEAMAALATILLSEVPKRRAVLESRLRRIEEYAEDTSTRATAADLRRQVTGRGVAAVAKGTPVKPAAEMASDAAADPAADDATNATNGAAHATNGAAHPTNGAAHAANGDAHSADHAPDDAAAPDGSGSPAEDGDVAAEVA